MSYYVPYDRSWGTDFRELCVFCQALTQCWLISLNTLVGKIGWSGKVGELGRCWSKGTKLQLCRINQSRDLLGSVTTTVNNIVLSPGNWLRE